MISFIVFLKFTILAYAVTLFTLMLCWSQRFRKLCKSILCCRSFTTDEQESKLATDIRKKMPADSSTKECPICLVEIDKKAIFTTCCHTFCSTCICLYIQEKRNSQIQCPFCRTVVTLIVLSEQKCAITAVELRKINNYNTHYSEEKDLYDSIAKLPEQVLDLGHEVFRTNGLVLLQNTAVNVCVIIVSWYLILNFCPVNGRLPDFIDPLLALVDWFWVLVLIGLGMGSMAR